MAQRAPRTRKQTASSTFGVGARNGHDASAFYARFDAPVVSKDVTINPCPVANSLFVGDARQMHQVPDASVGLVLTSPPYFANKDYEQAVETCTCRPKSRCSCPPATFDDYLAMVRAVVAEAHRVLEPGGRIAINVAGVGRKPFRPLHAYIWDILEAAGFLGRAEHIWVKGKGANGSAAWGTWRSAKNPTPRDVHEYVIVASKGRFDRAIAPKDRATLGLPHVDTVSREDFMSSTLSVWYIATESARRIGHPAPFPVELARRLIELHTYADDVVLDPFMGSGTTAVAAVRTGRRYVGFDLDPDYVTLAEERVAAELAPAPPRRARRRAA